MNNHNVQAEGPAGRTEQSAGVVEESQVSEQGDGTSIRAAHITTSAEVAGTPGSLAGSTLAGSPATAGTPPTAGVAGTAEAAGTPAAAGTRTLFTPDACRGHAEGRGQHPVDAVGPPVGEHAEPTARLTPPFHVVERHGR